MSRSRQERETIIRFDDTDEPAYLSTFSSHQARRWLRAGVVLTQQAGEWRGRAPKEAVWRCRRLGPDGQLQRTRRGRGFGRKLADAADPTTAKPPVDPGLLDVSGKPRKLADGSGNRNA